MSKKDLNLVEKFISLEEEIIDLLKEADLSVDFSADRKTVMAGLKSYITKVKKVDKLFAEYESLAEKIGGSTNEEEKNHELTCAVVDLREDSEEIKTEIESINGDVKVKQTKKKNNQAVREL